MLLREYKESPESIRNQNDRQKTAQRTDGQKWIEAECSLWNIKDIHKVSKNPLRNVWVGRERRPDKSESKRDHWFEAAEQLKRNGAERPDSLTGNRKGTFEARQAYEGFLFRLVMCSVPSWSWRRWSGSAGRCGGAVSRYIRLSWYHSLI